MIIKKPPHKRRIMTPEQAKRIRVYKESELYLFDHWADYCHTLDPDMLGKSALEEVAIIRNKMHLDTIAIELLAKIKQHFRLKLRGKHGVIHWHRVYLNGLRLSSQEGVNAKVVQLFSIFHDSQRKNEHRDKNHGKKGAELALKLRDYLPLNDKEFTLLITACSLHSSVLNHDNITIQACFDSDRLDLGRIGIMPDPAFLCTPMAKEKKIIEWGFHQSMGNSLPDYPFGLSDFWEESELSAMASPNNQQY